MEILIYKQICIHQTMGVSCFVVNDSTRAITIFHNKVMALHFMGVCEEISVNNQIFYDNELAEGLF